MSTVPEELIRLARSATSQEDFENLVRLCLRHKIGPRVYGKKLFYAFHEDGELYRKQGFTNIGHFKNSLHGSSNLTESETFTVKECMTYVVNETKLRMSVVETPPQNSWSFPRYEKSFEEET